MPHAFVRVPFVVSGHSLMEKTRYTRYLRVGAIDGFEASDAPGETRLSLGEERLSIAMGVDDFVQLLLATDEVSFGIAK